MPPSKREKFNFIKTFILFGSVAACKIIEGDSNRRIAKQAYTNSESLHTPSESAAAKLISGCDDRSYLCHLGFSVNTFESLHEEFTAHYPEECQTGRPRALNSKMVLALTLMWIRNSMKQETLGLIFGIPAATASRSRNLGIETILKVFNSNPNDPRWKIEWPSPTQMATFNEMVLANTTTDFEREVLAGVFGFIDGFNVTIQHPGDPLEQNAYYNGWKSGCFASQVIVYTPDGCICYVRYNCPGSWHDAQISIPMYTRLLFAQCPRPFKLLADSAFPCKGEFASKIASVPKENAKNVDRSNPQTQKKHAIITKHRQAVEWGMRSIRQVFGRINHKLTSHKQERNDILTVVWRLHNVRCRLDGINQIRTVYHSRWNARENTLEVSHV